MSGVEGEDKDENISEIKRDNSEGSLGKSLLELKQNIKLNRYDDFEEDLQ